MYNEFLFYNVIPNVPNDSFFRPPLLCDIMNSIVNYGKEKQTSISNLSSASRETIFDFKYPLSDNVNKEEFETMILDRFIMRRLGYETYTSWKIALKLKLNEIMPYYNKLFDASINWELFKDGENFTREKLINGNSEIDSRYSKLPQNEIEDVKDGTYMTDYTLGQNKSNGTESEKYSKDNNNKIDTYIKFIENNQKIMSLIYEDLESLFYGLAN